jgi:hypothetical protein
MIALNAWQDVTRPLLYTVRSGWVKIVAEFTKGAKREYQGTQRKRGDLDNAYMAMIILLNSHATAITGKSHGKTPRSRSLCFAALAPLMQDF